MREHTSIHDRLNLYTTNIHLQYGKEVRQLRKQKLLTQDQSDC